MLNDITNEYSCLYLWFKFLNIILKHKEMSPEFREATHECQFLYNYLWKFIHRFMAHSLESYSLKYRWLPQNLKHDMDVGIFI